MKYICEYANLNEKCIANTLCQHKVPHSRINYECEGGYCEAYGGITKCIQFHEPLFEDDSLFTIED